jgi:FkbM family methyltransferase
MAEDKVVAAVGLPYRLKKCKYGNFLYNRADSYIGRSLDVYGEYIDEEVRLLMTLLEPGDFVVEAGANMGADTVPLARRVAPNGHVLAIEPQRIVHQLLCANVALNGLANVTTPWCAVGDKPGELVIPPIDYGRENNFGGIAFKTEGAGERVPIVPIDQFELPKCAMIKVDVEHMEIEVLKGADATIKRCKPIIYVENDGDPVRSPALIRHLLDLGYYLFWHTPMLFNAKNFSNNSENVFGSFASCNMLCMPPGHAKEAVVQGMRAVLGADDVGLESHRQKHAT